MRIGLFTHANPNDLRGGERYNNLLKRKLEKIGYCVDIITQPKLMNDYDTVIIYTIQSYIKVKPYLRQNSVRIYMNHIIEPPEFWQQFSVYGKEFDLILTVGIEREKQFNDHGFTNIRTMQLLNDNLYNEINDFTIKEHPTILYAKKEYLKPVNDDRITTLEFEFFQNDIKSLFDKFDIVCGTGRIILEAALYGRPTFILNGDRYSGFLTPENYNRFQLYNFTDRNLTIKFNYNTMYNEYKTLTKYQLIGLQFLMSLNHSIGV